MVQSYPNEIATLYGRLFVTRDAARVRFANLVLDGSGGPILGRFSAGERQASPTVAGQSIAFFRDEVTSRRTGACFNEATPEWGQATDLRIRESRIHDCGVYPPTNHNHGVYLEVPTSRAQIVDNWIYDNADRCIQMYPDAGDAYIAHNVLDGCGEGLLFGGGEEDGLCAASEGNVAEQNVISNAQARWLVEANWSCVAAMSDNVVRDNCLWPTNSNSKYNWNSGLDGTPGYVAVGNTVADPLYVNRAAKDFRLRPEGQCVGKGPRRMPGPWIAPR